MDFYQRPIFDLGAEQPSREMWALACEYVKEKKGIGEPRFFAYLSSYPLAPEPCDYKPHFVFWYYSSTLPGQPKEYFGIRADRRHNLFLNDHSFAYFRTYYCGVEKDGYVSFLRFDGDIRQLPNGGGFIELNSGDFLHRCDVSWKPVFVVPLWEKATFGSFESEADFRSFKNLGRNSENNFNNFDDFNNIEGDSKDLF